MTASRDVGGALSLYVVSIHSNKKREKLFVSRFFCCCRKMAMWVPGCWLDKKRFHWEITTSIEQSFSYICLSEWWIFRWAKLLPFLLTHSDNSKRLSTMPQWMRQKQFVFAFDEGWDGENGQKCRRIQITQFDYLLLCCSFGTLKPT